MTVAYEIGCAGCGAGSSGQPEQHADGCPVSARLRAEHRASQLAIRREFACKRCSSRRFVEAESWAGAECGECGRRVGYDAIARGGYV